MTGRRIIPVAWALLASCAPVFAQEEPLPGRRFELGVRYWLSSGETERSHNAQGADPRLGNPTSVLLYENLDANVLEVFARHSVGEHWFLKGNLGVGRINGGSFVDEDFAAGQARFSHTTSSVTDGRIGYGTLDFGRRWMLRQGRINLGAFAGYSQWTENVDASGASDHLGFIGGDISRDVKVISNKTVWKALRLGFAGEFLFGSRTRLSLDLAAVPYAEVREEDSHHLRTDPGDPGSLGPTPNIIVEGRGWGVQWDAELRYDMSRRTQLGLGLRYWYMEATEGSRRLPNFPSVPELPIVDLYSTRTGITASLRRTW